MQIESVLVDGGSTDGTPDEARKAGFTKVIVRPGANIPVCRNAGALESVGDWLAYVDGDCELAEDWLEQALPFLEANDAVILGWPARPPEPMNRLQAAWHYHWMTKNPRLEEFKGRAVVKTEGFRLATTRNMILTRRAFDAVEGFNEELPTGEDTDFAFRAYMKQIPVLGYPELKVVHHGEPATMRQFFKQQLWHANRRSYQHIVRLSGGKIGGNAPKFAILFFLCADLAVIGLAAAAIFRSWWPLLLCLPMAGVVAGPAFLMCLKGGGWKHFPMLAVIYAAYGVARTIDLLGWAREKKSWKSR